MSTDAQLPAGAPPAFHLLAKPTGAVCNLNCTYCFFLSKHALYPGSRFRMSDEVLETYVRQLFEAHRTPEVTVAWQGGEPTLIGLEFFERAVELVEQYRRHDQRVAYTIQTNGTLLDDAWGAFFKQHNFLVGLSIDGPPELHDAYRVDRRGQGTFDRVRRGWDALAKHGVDANILCTIHAANGDRPLEVYRFFRDELEARFIQFIPIVERATAALLPLANAGWSPPRRGPRPLYTQEGNLVTERSVRPEQFGRFLIAIFEEWVRRDVGRVFVQHFDAALANWYGEPPGVCVFSETCGGALALEHTGDVYSCDHYVEPAYKLGNIRDTHLVDLLISPRQDAFGRAKRDTLPQYCCGADCRRPRSWGCTRRRTSACKRPSPAPAATSPARAAAAASSSTATAQPTPDTESLPARLALPLPRFRNGALARCDASVTARGLWCDALLLEDDTGGVTSRTWPEMAYFTCTTGSALAWRLPMRNAKSWNPKNRLSRRRTLLKAMTGGGFAMTTLLTGRRPGIT